MPDKLMYAIPKANDENYKEEKMKAGQNTFFIILFGMAV